MTRKLVGGVVGDADGGLDFRALFEAAPTALVVLDPDFVIVGVSDAYLAVTDTSRDAIVGKLMFDVFPDVPGERAATGVANLRTALQRAARDRVPVVTPVQKYPIPRLQRDGGGFVNRYWAPVTVPVSHADGRLAWLIYRVDDVTAYVTGRLGDPSQQELTDQLPGRAESEIAVWQRLQERQQDHHLQAVLDSLDTAVLGCDADARPILANQAARRLFGDLLGELVPLSQWPRHLGLSDPSGHSLTTDEEPLLRVLRGEHVHDVEVMAQPSDGSARVFRVNGRPVSGGGQLAAVVALHEITLQRRAEQLKQCEIAVAEILGKPDPADSLLAEAVERIGGMLGWAAAEFYSVDEVGRVLRRVTCWSRADGDLPCGVPDQLTEGQGIPGRAWRTSDPVWVADLHTDPAAAEQTSDWGHLRAAMAVPIPSGTATLGVLVCYSNHAETPDDMRTAVLTGIAAHIGEFLERRRAEQYAAELHRSREEYALLVGHELRTPLTNIQAYTDLIADEPDMPTTERAEMLEVMQRNTARLHGLVGRLLDVAGVRSGHLSTRPQRMDLADLVRTATTDARTTITDGLRIDVNLPTDEVLLDGDPHRLRQVVDELLVNAIAWAADDSTVGINLHADSYTCVLAISNTGAAIAEADRGRLFELLFRTDAALNCAVPGTGLGLTLARAIVEQHGGIITLSEPDEAATTFTVRLPTYRATTPAGDGQ